MLNKNVRFFLIYKDDTDRDVMHFMPACVGGRTDLADKRLEDLFLYL